MQVASLDAQGLWGSWILLSQETVEFVITAPHWPPPTRSEATWLSLGDGDTLILH